MPSKSKIRTLLLAMVLLTCASVALFAQRSRSRGERERPSRPDRSGLPEWELNPEFKSDIFTFVRIQYGSTRGWGRYEKWTIDWPDAELNLSYRLQQLTSIKTHPDGIYIELTDKELFNYPFIYIVEPGDMVLRDEEVANLRRYLLSGGFLMVDDFWGDREWENFYREIKRVFPEREPQELSLDHPVFNCIFPLKEKPQIPNYRTGTYSQYDGVTWEGGPDGREVHIKGIFDDKGRMMAIICHNTDNGDGWEREGENVYFFREFSEKKAYPLGINIIFYAMTH